jgi:ABC-2 type transport system ATP-binding protein
MSSVIRTRDLSKKFRNTTVLDRLNLEVPAGSIFGLVGPNGAGKTTTIKVLMNIYPPSSGHSEILDTDSRRISPAQLAQIGYVSENQEMPGWMTVQYYMDFLSNFYPTWDRLLAAELLRQFELPLHRKLRHLSHGMRMKAALASSLAYRPRLMVLDEPFTGLDALIRDELIEGILTRAENTTIFISSHDLTEIESFASHIGYLDNGRLQFSEDMDSLRARFREITLTFDCVPQFPSPWPPGWLRPQKDGAVMQFIETEFDAERTAAAVRRIFPEHRDMTASPMPLRSIFVTLAKVGRKTV